MSLSLSPFPRCCVLCLCLCGVERNLMKNSWIVCIICLHWKSKGRERQNEWKNLIMTSSPSAVIKFLKNLVISIILNFEWRHYNKLLLLLAFDVAADWGLSEKVASWTFMYVWLWKKSNHLSGQKSVSDSLPLHIFILIHFFLDLLFVISLCILVSTFFFRKKEEEN